MNRRDFIQRIVPGILAFFGLGGNKQAPSKEHGKIPCNACGKPMLWLACDYHDEQAAWCHHCGLIWEYKKNRREVNVYCLIKRPHGAPSYWARMWSKHKQK
jgi:hypothetical protein